MGNDFDANNEEDEDTDDEDEDGMEAGMDSEEGAKHRQAILDSSDLSAQEKVKELQFGKYADQSVNSPNFVIFLMLLILSFNSGTSCFS